MVDEADEAKYLAAERKAFEKNQVVLPDIMDYTISRGSVAIMIE